MTMSDQVPEHVHEDLTPPFDPDPPRKVPPWDPEPRRGAHTTLWEVVHAGTTVLRYVDGTGSPALDAPRPHLHPLRTPAGVVVTDASPPDHSWHLGLNVGIQDVAGANIWGGRTYLRDEGYTWRRDHGRVDHTGWDRRDVGSVTERLDWRGPDGADGADGADSTGSTDSTEAAVLLHETRTLDWRPLGEGAWRLDVGLRLEVPEGGPADVALGSPGSKGREAAGYGGLFWRFPPCTHVDVRSAAGRGEDAVHGTVPADGAPWVAWSATSHAPGAGGDFTAVLAVADDVTAQDPWFVRVTGYPGIGSAIAWDAPTLVRAGTPLERRFTVLVGDGRWSDAEVVARLARPASPSEGSA